MTEEARSRDWHLEKTVSVGHLVTTSVVIITGLWYFAGLENRISLNSNEIAHQRNEINRVEAAQKSYTDWIGKQLQEMRVEQKQENQRINDKLDKLVDRLSRSGG